MAVAKLRWTSLLGFACVLGACASEPDGGLSGTWTAEASASGESSASSSAATSSGTATETESESTTGQILDIPAGTEGSAEGSVGMGCEKVDFSFVIDNSESMEDDQIRLLAAFPGFIDAIRNNIQAEDYQIGVITTDDHVYDYENYDLGGTPTECEVMGGLVTESWDYASNSHRVCTPFVSGKNFLTQDEPDLEGQFECIAFVDDEGSTDEAPMAAIEEALKLPPMACNEGFLRDDALLVIVLITDEDDDVDGNPGSGGNPQQWYDTVIAAKQGIEENAVVLALVGMPECPYEHTTRLIEWAQMFGERGFVGPVCEDDYAGFFAQSVGVVDEACDQFVPVP